MDLKGKQVLTGKNKADGIFIIELAISQGCNQADWINNGADGEAIVIGHAGSVIGVYHELLSGNEGERIEEFKNLTTVTVKQVRDSMENKPPLNPVESKYQTVREAMVAFNEGVNLWEKTSEGVHTRIDSIISVYDAFFFGDIYLNGYTEIDSIVDEACEEMFGHSSQNCRPDVVATVRCMIEHGFIKG